MARFSSKTRQSKDQLRDRGIDAHYLNKKEAKRFINQYYTQNYTQKNLSHNNYKVTRRIYWYWFQKIQDLQLSRC